jgi:ketosteroid isomerase-like protein
MGEYTESIRRLYGFNWASTANRQEWLSVASELFADDFEYHFAPEVSDRTLRGLADMSNFMLAIEEDFREYRQTAQRAFSSDDCVVVIGETEGRGRLSGLLFRTPFAHIWTIEDGLAVQLDDYVDVEQAMAVVAGLEDENAPDRDRSFGDS